MFPPAVPRIILKNRPNSLLNIRKGSSVSLHSRDREQKSIFHRFIKKAASKSHFIGSQTPNTYKKPMNYRQLVAADNYTRKTSAKLPDLFCVDMDDHHKDFSHPFIVDMEDGLLPPSMVEHSLYKPFISVQNSNDSQSFYNHHNEEIEIHKDIGSGLIFNSHDAKNASMVSRKRSSSDADITLLANYANSHLKERIIDENIKNPLISKRWNELPEKPPRLACSALSKSDNVCWELLSTLGNPISVIPSRLGKYFFSHTNSFFYIENVPFHVKNILNRNHPLLEDHIHFLALATRWLVELPVRETMYERSNLVHHMLWLWYR